MDLFDGSLHRIRELVAYSGYFKLVGAGDYHFHPDWLEPVEPKTLNVGDPVEPMQSWVPEGYSVVDIAVPDAMASEIGEGNALVYERPRIGQRYFCLLNESRVADVNWCGHACPVIVPTTPPSEQYRDPTQADVGEMVEVSDCQEMGFETRELLAVISDQNLYQRFVCRDRCNGRHALTWKYARIKITPDTP
jgi:hypothetical protein